jgi:dinuclear metal center YbgI/SA1388 family protein
MPTNNSAPVTVKDIAAAVHRLAPPQLAYDWDNVGLQVGDPAAPASKVLICLEVNQAVIDHCVANEIPCILSHHPLIFRPLKTISTTTPASRLAAQLICRNIALIAAHTNLDRVMQGTNGALGELLQLRDPEILEPVSVERQYKFTVFVPRDYTPKLIEAIHRGGGGRIGAYSHCTFRAPGVGTFVPEEGSNPWQGAHGRMEEAEEDRLETVVPEAALSHLLQEVRQAHPYDEVAFDVFPLHEAGPRFGLGLTGTIPSKQPLRQFARLVREAVGADYIQVAGESAWPVKKIAIVTGSAGSSVSLITKDKADVVVTGELSYHLVQDCLERGVGVICVGHAVSERCFAPYVARHLEADPLLNADGVEFIPYTKFPEPLKLVVARESTDEPTTQKKVRK